MELDLTNEPPVPDYNAFHQLSADHLDQSPSALVDSPTQASITLLRDKVLHQPTPHSSAANFAMIDQWNAAQPISKLPLELIVHIATLRFPMIDYIGRTNEMRPCDYMKGLASFSVISRMWRKAIIGTPSLWGLLSVDLPPHINRICLERSGTRPLMVVVVSWMARPDLSPDGLLDIALPHRDRWSHVNLGFIPLARVMEYLTSPAPRLETFRLSVSLYDTTHLEPIDLFGGYAPSLQDVQVYGKRIVIGSEVFRGLRSLDLDTILGEVISVDQVLAILSASQGLESLFIMHPEIGFTRLPPSSTRTPIQLPHLKCIVLDILCAEAVGNILRFIRAPNCDSFRLSTSQASNDPSDLTDFFDQSFDHFDAFLPSILALHGSSELSLSDRISWTCTGPESDDTPYFCFEMHSKMVNIIIPWISRFLGSEPPRPAHELNVTFGFGGINDEIRAGLKTLALLPNVQSFRMNYLQLSVGTILYLLGDPNKDARAHAFPRLKEFRLEGTFGRPLQDLEAMLMRRYGESGQSVIGPPPIRIILAPPFGWPRSNTRPQFEDICRIRAMRGVESVTLPSSFGQEGMPACIHDDAERE